MRNAFAEEITKISLMDDTITLLSGDIGNRLFDSFKEQNANRFFNCGVAEANMMGVAAGLAASGLRPVVYTITPFTTTRCLEQIKIDACYHNLPITIVGTGSGLAYASLGPTHHSCEDIGILRPFPNITIFCPADPIEMRLGLNLALKKDGPTYIRLGKKGEPNLHKSEPKHFVLGKSNELRSGETVCIITTGTIAANAMAAADQLERCGVSTHVESFHTVKPLDTNSLERLFNKFKTIAILEEHFESSGLYSAVAEWALKKTNVKNRVISFGVPDKFLHHIGSQNYALNHFGLDSDSITKRVLNSLGVA